jgi:8-oxo-dGTP pyrophosphatase MutT (NUDIX family)
MPPSREKSAGFPTKQQVSAGGVAYRKSRGHTEVAIIRVAPEDRWQLPKGIVDKGESPEEAALREVREEAGIDAEIVTRIETIEYWYFSGKGGDRVRFHKFVHFFLMKYISGSTDDHDHEVEEARWVRIEEAIDMLAFKSERDVVGKARELIG